MDEFDSGEDFEEEGIEETEDFIIDHSVEMENLDDTENINDISETIDTEELEDNGSASWLDGLSTEELYEAREALEGYQEQEMKEEAFNNYLDTLSVDELHDLRDALDQDSEQSDGDAKVLRMY